MVFYVVVAVLRNIRHSNYGIFGLGSVSFGYILYTMKNYKLRYECLQCGFVAPFLADKCLSCGAILRMPKVRTVEVDYADKKSRQ